MYILSASYSEQATDFAAHEHDAHELIYIVSGSIAVGIGGEELIAEKGSLLVFNRFEEHSIRILSNEYRRYTLLISPDLSRSAENYLLSAVLIDRSRAFSHMIDCSSSDDEICETLRLMVNEYTRREPMYDRLLDAMLMRLLIVVYRISPRTFLTEDSRNADIVRAVRSEFEQNYSEHYTLSALAAEYHVSPSHLSHAFKAMTGHSPIEYLMSCRISAAKRLLLTTEKRIKEIIDLCGFSDESNFSRLFRVRTGMTPSAFRRQKFARTLDNSLE